MEFIAFPIWTPESWLKCDLKHQKTVLILFKTDVNFKKESLNLS